MAIEMDINTGVLTINDKYEIRPLMTWDEVANSNLVELMVDFSKEKIKNKRKVKWYLSQGHFKKRVKKLKADFCI